MNDNERQWIMSVTRSLMVADNLGDVHDQINRLHHLLHLPEPEGDFSDGFTEQDFERLLTPEFG